MGPALDFDYFPVMHSSHLSYLNGFTGGSVLIH
jgi:hypothetical protein